MKTYLTAYFWLIIIIFRGIGMQWWFIIHELKKLRSSNTVLIRATVHLQSKGIVIKNVIYNLEQHVRLLQYCHSLAQPYDSGVVGGLIGSFGHEFKRFCIAFMQ